MNENAFAAAFIVVLGLARAISDARREAVNTYGPIPNECTSKKTVFPVLWLHSIIWLFTYFGWMFNSKIVLWAYMASNLVIWICWQIFDGCILTHYVNKACGLDILYDPMNEHMKFKAAFMVYGYATAIWKLV